MKILMVCLGNICRSPMAEGILREKAKQAGLSWTVDSAGTTGHSPGIQPHALSQKVAALHGIDISNQHCRQFTKDDISRFDHIYAMDEDNYREIRRISGSNWDESKVSLLMDEVYPNRPTDIPDPWYGSEPGYHKVFEMIDLACEKIIEKAG